MDDGRALARLVSVHSVRPSPNLAASWVPSERSGGTGTGRIYVVEPTGPFEDDPNVTNKKFPGNVTRSYRLS